MNTKKILAVSLAATTAFSMFGAAMSVGAAVPALDDAYVVYDAAVAPMFETLTAYVNGSADGILKLGDYTLTLGQNGTDVTVAGGTTNTPAGFAVALDSFLKSVARDSAGKVVGTGAEVGSDFVYLYDYQKANDDADYNKAYDAVVALKTAVEAYVADSVVANLQAAVNTFITTFSSHIKVNANAPVPATSSNSYASRYSVDAAFIEVYKKAKDLNLSNYVSTELLPRVTVSGATYNPNGFNLTNGVINNGVVSSYSAFANAAPGTLLGDIRIAYGTNGAGINTLSTSEVVYLTKSYTRILDQLNSSDPSNLIAQYEREMEKLSNRVREDYDSYGDWVDFKGWLDKAQAEAAKGAMSNYSKAMEHIASAKTIKVLRPDVKELGDLLATLFTAKEDLTAVNNSYTDMAESRLAYKPSDYIRYNSLLTDSTTIAYRDAFINDAQNLYESSYTEAIKVYKDVMLYYYNYNTAKSDVTKAIARLQESLDSLGAVNGPSSWDELKLEAYVDEIGQHVADDFYVSRTGYKRLMGYYETAEKILAKAKPGKSEVSNIITQIETAYPDFMNTVKTISYTTKKEMNDTLKIAEDTLSDIANETGAQYVALSNAILAARKVNGGSAPSEIMTGGLRKATASDYADAIAELNTAITGFTQPQGWYQENGKWMYGEDDSFYVDGWKKIGSTWFYFNNDGTAKQSEWFQLDGNWYYANSNCGAATGWAKVGGKWYFFKGNNAMKTGWEKVDGQWYYMDASGAMVTGWAQINGKYYYFSKASNALGQMAANTTIDGYKIDANGVWVK